jgi:hypothetical protein
VRDRAACSALQALEVADGAEQLDEVIAPARLAQQRLDGVEPGADGGDVGERRQHPQAQQPAAHRRLRLVEHVQQ